MLLLAEHNCEQLQFAVPVPKEGYAFIPSRLAAAVSRFGNFQYSMDSAVPALAQSLRGTGDHDGEIGMRAPLPPS